MKRCSSNAAAFFVLFSRSAWARLVAAVFSDQKGIGGSGTRLDYANTRDDLHNIPQLINNFSSPAFRHAVVIAKRHDFLREVADTPVWKKVLSQVSLHRLSPKRKPSAQR
jgi:hypothetical protein